MQLVERAAAKAEDVRFALRSQTRREHEDLDSHPAFAAMTDGTLGLAGYRQIMRALHQVYAVLDPAIADACDRFDAGTLGFAYAPRGPVLARDLAVLDDRLPPQSGTPGRHPPVTVSAPAMATAPALAGVLYVVEGSVLGGAVLHRATHGLLGEAAGNGYWSWCAEEGAGRWAMTCRLLSRLDRTEARGEMAATARDTFQMITLALAPLRHEMEQAAC